jgi:GTP-dependent dephospho-CoA kinase
MGDFFVDFTKTYKITPSARKLLAKPMGTLYPGTISENIPKIQDWVKNQPNKPHFVCVGDVVTQGFLNDKILSSYLKMCIVDEKTKRGDFQLSTNIIEYYITRILNPPGFLRSSAMLEIQSQLQSKQKTLVIVEGEEDLLVIPIIAFSPENTFVIYGQPPITDLEENIPAGLVMIPVNSDTKSQVKKLFDHFEKIQ